MATEITKASLLDLLRRTNDPNWIEPLLADKDSSAIIGALLDQAVYLAAELQASCDAATISLAPGGRSATSVLTLARTASGIGGTIPKGYRFIDAHGLISVAQTPITVLAGALSVTVSVQTLRQTELANTIVDPGFSLSPDNLAALDTGGTNALIGISPAPGGFPPIVSTTFTSVQQATPLTGGVVDYLAAHGNERGQLRQAGEPDGLYRTRVRNVQDAVSPIAVIQGVLGAAQVRGLPVVLLREPLNDQATAGLKTSLSLDRFDELFFEDGVHVTDFMDDAGIVPYREMVSGREKVKYFRLEMQAAITDPITGRQFWEAGSPAYAAAGSPGAWQDLNTRPDMLSALLSVLEEANRKRAGGVAFDLFLRTPPKYQYAGSSTSGSLTTVWTATPPTGRTWYLVDGLFGIDSSIPIVGAAWQVKFTFSDATTFTTSTFSSLLGTLQACPRTMGVPAKQITQIEGKVQSDGTHAAHLVGQIWLNELLN